LGKLVVVSMIAAKAKMCLLVVSPAGTGKSTASRIVARMMDDHIYLDSVTRSGLRRLQDRLSNFDGLTIIDDMGKVDTEYSRIATTTSFTELCYSHFIEKHTHSFSVRIRNYLGAAILNFQPIVFAQIIRSPEWEAAIMDKSLRYYHLLRPINPNPELPNLDFHSIREIESISLKETMIFEDEDFVRMGLAQWSKARVLEHLSSLLKAVAALENEKEVKLEHKDFLKSILKPMLVESYVVSKKQLEAERYLDYNLFAVMVEFATYDKLTLQQIALDYKISKATAFRILEAYPDYFLTIKRHPDVKKPSDKLIKILLEVGAKEE